MTNPVKQLQRALSKQQGLMAGDVVHISGEAIKVRTARGVQSVTRQPGDATQYRAGDAVSIIDGYIRGRRQSGKKYVV